MEAHGDDCGATRARDPFIHPVDTGNPNGS